MPLPEILLSLLLTGAATPGATEQLLMNEIERSVRLPNAAEPLSAYGRYYAFGVNGRVTAVYMIPFVPSNPDAGCSTIDEHFNLKPCTIQERDELKALNALMSARQLKAGDRRWLANADDLPFKNDGGCTQVTIEYEISTKRFLMVECNGNP